jgi:predicted alpha/beta superfamily hydrolase
MIVLNLGYTQSSFSGTASLSDPDGALKGGGDGAAGLAVDTVTPELEPAVRNKASMTLFGHSYGILG